VGVPTGVPVTVIGMHVELNSGHAWHGSSQVTSQGWKVVKANFMGKSSRKQTVSANYAMHALVHQENQFRS
jgi:hypothetical protein